MNAVKFIKSISCKECVEILNTYGILYRLMHLKRRSKLIRCQGCERLKELTGVYKCK